MRNPYPKFVWFVGSVVDTSSDPLRLGRVRVRAIGFHPSSIELKDLPWAPVLNGGAARISTGQMVIGFFMDGEEAQQPCVLGKITGAVAGGTVFNFMRRLGGSINSLFRTSSDPIPREDLPSLQLGGEKNKLAKLEAEKFLGRSISDEEWEELLRTTVAEASSDSKEQAQVAGVILNRTRNKFGGDDTITDVVKANNQFQAVTGTPKDRSPSKNYTNPTPEQIASVTNSILTRLSTADKGWLNFTAADPKIYGPGTNPGYRIKALNTPGSQQIGGTIFFTERR
jgi:hypothetical protein